MDRKLYLKNFTFWNSQDKACRSPLIHFILFFIFISVTLSLLFNVWHSHLKTKRNPLFRRAWVEHVYKVLPKQPGEKLIIIISNSQGYGKEINDEQTYAYILEKNLVSKLKTPVRILNWSVEAGDGPELTVLLAATNRLHPDVLLFVVSPGNFDQRFMRLNKSLKPEIPWASDCRFLLGFSDVRQYVPETFVKHFFKTEDKWDIYLGRIYPLWRHRTLLTSWLTQFKPLGRFEKYGHVSTWFASKKSNPKKSPLDQAGKVDSQLLNYCLESTKSLKAKKIFVMMPLYSLARNRYPKFMKEYHRHFERTGYDVWDLSDQVSDDYFLTYTHMNQNGHAKLADLLTEQLTS